MGIFYVIGRVKDDFGSIDGGLIKFNQLDDYHVATAVAKVFYCGV